MLWCCFARDDLECDVLRVCVPYGLLQQFWELFGLYCSMRAVLPDCINGYLQWMCRWVFLAQWAVPHCLSLWLLRLGQQLLGLLQPVRPVLGVGCQLHSMQDQHLPDPHLRLSELLSDSVPGPEWELPQLPHQLLLLLRRQLLRVHFLQFQHLLPWGAVPDCLS